MLFRSMFASIAAAVTHQINRVPIAIALAVREDDVVQFESSMVDQGADGGPATAIVRAQERSASTRRPHGHDAGDHGCDGDNDQQQVDDSSQRGSIRPGIFSRHGCGSLSGSAPCDDEEFRGGDQALMEYPSE